MFEQFDAFSSLSVDGEFRPSRFRLGSDLRRRTTHCLESLDLHCGSEILWTVETDVDVLTSVARMPVE